MSRQSLDEAKRKIANLPTQIKGKSVSPEQKCMDKLKKFYEVAKEEYTEDKKEEQEQQQIESKDKNEAKKSVSTSVLMFECLPKNFRTKISQSAEKTSKSEESELSISEADLRADAKVLIDPKELFDTYWKYDSYNVKLIATALILKEKDGKFKNFFGKMTGIFPYGTVHTAVQIGGLILEWNNSSLVIPLDASSFYNRKAIAALDLEVESESGEAMVKKAFDMVAKWNGKEDYSASSANCQRFTNELLEVLGVSTKFPPEIKTFLDSLGTMEKQDICFEFKDQKFKSHKDLDEYVANEYQDGDLKDPSKLNTETRLLKAYDRVFWLRYLGVRHSERLEVAKKQELLKLYEEAPTKCPFGDPKTTGTLYGKDL